MTIRLQNFFCVEVPNKKDIKDPNKRTQSRKSPSVKVVYITFLWTQRDPTITVVYN